MRRFTKREVLQDISPLQLTRLDVGDKNNWACPKEVNIGLGAESILKVVYEAIVSNITRIQKMDLLVVT